MIAASELSLVLVGRDELSEAWRAACGELPGVSVFTGSILDVDCDAMVSPANSFGFMRGGVDLAYLHRFGVDLQGRVRAALAARHGGELPVGCAEIVSTAAEPGAGAVPWLVVAPTMRVPTRVTGTVSAFLAARAALTLVTRGAFPEGAEWGSCAGRPVRDVVRRLAVPGLGTGTGALPPHVCAAQVRAAIEEVLLGRVPPPGTLAQAAASHERLVAGDAS